MAAPEPVAIDWQELEQLSFQPDGQGETVVLEAGQATRSYGGASEDSYVLQNRVTQGDLDDDGDDDLVAHIIQRSAGTGVFHLIVPVINDAGRPVAQRPVPIGDRIVMDQISVRDELIEVSLFDRSEDEPFTVITLRKTLVIELDGAEPRARIINTEPIEDLPLLGPDLPDIDIQFETGATSASGSGSIEFGQRQTYVVLAEAGQWLTVTLVAPLGVWLDIRLDDDVLASVTERSQRIETSLPSSGPWRVSVVSAHGEPTGYQLTVEAFPIGLGPEPEQPQPSTPPTPTQLSSATPGKTEPDRSEQPRKPTEPDGTIHLTFDDGPHPSFTPQVLDILGRYGARATFFVLGSLAERHPDLLERITSEGHTLANHSWNHENLAGLPKPSFDETITRTQAVLGEQATPCLRPPYGSRDAFTRDWAASHGLELVLWTVDTNDWRRPGAWAIASRIIAGAGDGAIVLLHDGGGNRSQTMRALESALFGLSGRFRFEPVCTPKDLEDRED